MPRRSASALAVHGAGTAHRHSAPFARIQGLAVLADLAPELLAIVGTHLAATVLAPARRLARVGLVAIAPEILPHRPLPATPRIVVPRSAGPGWPLPLRHGNLAGDKQDHSENMREALHGGDIRILLTIEAETGKGSLEHTTILCQQR